MNLNIYQARELGEALLDACEDAYRTGTSHTVAFIDEEHAVAMPIEKDSVLSMVEYAVNVLL